MNYKLPFYIRGGISRIEEKNINGKIYYFLYRYKDTEKEEFLCKQLPKTKKNYEQLIDNYYRDMVGFLEANKIKNAVYEESLKSKRFSKKALSLGIISLIGIVLSSIPMIMTYDNIGYLGIVLDSISAPLLVGGATLLQKEKQLDKKQRFVTDYDSMEKRYNLYKKNTLNKLNKNERTIYNGIAREFDKEKILSDNTLFQTVEPKKKQKIC